MDQTIILDEGTTEAVFKLKKLFKVKSFIGVIRKSIALSRICARYIDKNGEVKIVNKNGEQITVNLRK